MECVAVCLKVLHSAGVTCGVCCCQSEGVAQCRGARPVESVTVSLKVVYRAGQLTRGVCCCQSEGVAQCMLLSV